MKSTPPLSKRTLRYIGISWLEHYISFSRHRNSLCTVQGAKSNISKSWSFVTRDSIGRLLQTILLIPSWPSADAEENLKELLWKNYRDFISFIMRIKIRAPKTVRVNHLGICFACNFSDLLSKGLALFVFLSAGFLTPDSWTAWMGSFDSEWSSKASLFSLKTCQNTVHA